jgi:hypothetical protein
VKQNAPATARGELRQQVVLAALDALAVPSGRRACAVTVPPAAIVGVSAIICTPSCAAAR